MKSLRARLVGFILLAVAVVWVGTAFIVWREAHKELHELVDGLPAAARADIEHERRHVVEEIAEHLAQPVVVAFPLLALLLVLAVTVALRPLRRLAGEVAARAPDHLQALPEDGIPSEAAPLVRRLNALFADIARALENERRFTADAAHELRTPLAAIKAQAQVARAATDVAGRDHALAQILAGCDRATHLTEQLLTLARLDAPRVAAPQAVELRTLAARVLAELAGSAVARGGGVELADGDIFSVDGDETLLAVLLRNLVDNALRHNPPGTLVTVSIADGELCVADNGPGLGADEVAQLMQRFHRGQGTRGEGSGLGLSIVQRIAELHGARFSFGQKLGGSGTAARVVWPRH